MYKFEHPLTEKVRIYLRVETLLEQVHQSADFHSPLEYQVFFRSLFDLLDIFEQIQLKPELAKDLEKQRLHYKHWLNVADVDQSKLQQVLNNISEVHKTLLAAERFGESLKQDRFLSTIRQRFSLLGGSCCFDLPTLHYWLHLPLEQRQQDIRHWTQHLSTVTTALDLWLKLTRDSASLKPKTARAGFYQAEVEGANILRLTTPIELGAYPMISGNKSRFSIKFMSFQTGFAYSQDVEFQLAIC